MSKHLIPLREMNSGSLLSLNFLKKDFTEKYLEICKGREKEQGMFLRWLQSEVSKQTNINKSYMSFR